MGRYRIIRKIASGGMAEVLLGKVLGAEGFERLVAIKRILPALALDPQFVELFLQEARLTVALRHSNIVQVHDFGAVQGHYYQVLEYVDGANLRQLVTALAHAGRRLDVAEACYIVQQVAEGLAAAHDATRPDGTPLNIIHRDINPSNVMISHIGEVKLADFGIAKAADGRAATQAGIIKGKTGYLSPEQLQEEVLDQRSDLFLMGLLLHELLTGRKLFDAPDALGALRQLTRFDPRQLEPVPGVPAALWRMVVRLLEPSREARLPTARALCDELTTFLFESRMRVGPRELARLMDRAFPVRPSTAELSSWSGTGPSGGELQVSAPPPLPPARPAVEVGVILPAAAGVARMRAVELTRGGALLVTERDLPPLRTRVRVRFDSRPEPLEVAAEVVLHVEHAAAQAWRLERGFAVEFVDRPEGFSELVQALTGRPSNERATPPGARPACTATPRVA